MTEEQPETVKKTVAIAVDRDAYAIARNMSRRNGVTRKIWVSNAIRIAAAMRMAFDTQIFRVTPLRRDMLRAMAYASGSTAIATVFLTVSGCSSVIRPTAAGVPLPA